MSKAIAIRSSSFRRSDFELRMELTVELCTNLKTWTTVRNGWGAIVGTVVDSGSRAKDAAALAFRAASDGSFRIVVVHIDRASQCRSGPVRSLAVDPHQPIEEADLQFEDLLKLVALSNPCSDSVREIGPLQFSLISNSEEPDLGRVLR